MFEGEIDERILQSHRLVAAIENIIADRPGQAVPFLHERMEKPRDALAMQALVAHGPAHDLPHALHLVEAREVHQHGEAGEKLQSLGRSEEHTSELQSLMRISYAVFCLKKKKRKNKNKQTTTNYTVNKKRQ